MPRSLVFPLFSLLFIIAVCGCGGDSPEAIPVDVPDDPVSAPQPPTEQEPPESTDSGGEGKGSEEIDPAPKPVPEPISEQTPQPKPPPVAIDTAAVKRLKDRVTAVQNDDGSFGWRRSLAEPLDPTQPGFQNVTGITALGLFGAADLLREEGWQETADRVAGYLEGRLDLLLANPADVGLNLSCPNWTFFARYLERFPNPLLQEKVTQGLHALLDARDLTFGDNASMRADGLFNRVIQGRAAIPGIIPWDLALCVEGLMAMTTLSDDFEEDYEDSLALLDWQISSFFLPAYDADPLLPYADTSLSLPIFVMKSSPSAESFASTVDGLHERLTAIIRPDGSVTNGSDNDGPQQASAYALLAFKILRDPVAQAVQDFLQGEIASDGIIADAEDQIETFEVEGEALRALAYIP